MGRSEASSISAAQGLRELLPLAIKHLLGSHHGSSLRGKFWGTSMLLSHPHAHLSASPVCPPHTSCHYSWSCVTSNEAAPHRSASPAARQPSASPHTALQEEAPGTGSVCSQQGSPQGPQPCEMGLSCGMGPPGPGPPLRSWLPCGSGDRCTSSTSRMAKGETSLQPSCCSLWKSAGREEWKEQTVTEGFSSAPSRAGCPAAPGARRRLGQGWPRNQERGGPRAALPLPAPLHSLACCARRAAPKSDSSPVPVRGAAEGPPAWTGTSVLPIAS